MVGKGQVVVGDTLRSGNGIVLLGPSLTEPHYMFNIEPNQPGKLWLIPTHHDPVAVVNAIWQAMAAAGDRNAAALLGQPITAQELSGRSEDARQQLPVVPR
jgi:hypothetical protein